MKHSKQGELYGAVLIHEQELRNLVEFLEKHFNKISFNGKTKDGTNINFSDLEDFISYANYDTRKIIKLELSCTNEKQGIDIIFKNERLFVRPSTIEYYLKYDDQNWGFKFEDDIKNELKEFRPYYNYLTYFNLTYATMALLVIMVFLLISIDYYSKVLGFTGILKDGDYKSVNNYSGPAVGFTWAILIYILAYLLNKLRNYLFPVLFIATGKQVKEYQKRKNIARIVFGIIGVGIAINLITQLLINGL
ncbi:MAG: hypothetical protein JJU28_05970 [Cyclobacteriaceae bacterium]|nr:hypothetical protein [Cyclobacteriaceae bacterium]